MYEGFSAESLETDFVQESIGHSSFFLIMRKNISGFKKFQILILVV